MDIQKNTKFQESFIFLGVIDEEKTIKAAHEKRINQI